MDNMTLFEVFKAIFTESIEESGIIKGCFLASGFVIVVIFMVFGVLIKWPFEWMFEKLFKKRNK